MDKIKEITIEENGDAPVIKTETKTGKPDYEAIENKAKNKIEGASTKPNTWTQSRDLLVDIGIPVALTEGLSQVIGRIAGKNAINKLKQGKDSSLGHQDKITKNAIAKENEIKDLMAQNKTVAKEALENKKAFAPALHTIVTNSAKEAEIGPRFVDDIAKILDEDTGLTWKQVNKAITEWYNENKDNTEMIKLIEAKDPDVTFGHSIRVGEIAKQVGKKAGLSELQAQKLADAALLHDIGKIQVPDNIINSKFDKNKYPELFKWLINHDAIGSEIIELDPYKSKIAKYHHRNTINDPEVDYVTVADIYDAITSPRSYKKGHTKDFALNSPEGLSRNVKYGNFSEDYLDLIRALDADGLLNEYYKVDSDLDVPYKSMKANAIKDTVNKDYVNDSRKTLGSLLTAIAFRNKMADTIDRDKGGIEPTTMPTVSEVIGYAFPGYRAKEDKIKDMKEWYEKGLVNKAIESLIIDTDFSKNNQVTKLWKVWNEYVESGK